jgi:hypothetical protein
MSLQQTLHSAGPSLLYALAVLACTLGGMALMIGQRRWASRLLLLGVFLAVMVGFV